MTGTPNHGSTSGLSGRAASKLIVDARDQFGTEAICAQARTAALLLESLHREARQVHNLALRALVHDRGSQAPTATNQPSFLKICTGCARHLQNCVHGDSQEHDVQKDKPGVPPK